MNEEMLVCQNCNRACELNWMFCPSCGQSLSHTSKEKIVYVFVDVNGHILKPVKDSLNELMVNNASLVVAGHFIAKVFLSNLTHGTAFTPISTYSYEPGHFGMYHKTENFNYVIPPTK